QLQPDAADVFLEIGIVVDAHLLLHLRVGFLSGGNFLRLAHQIELTLAGRRICRARGGENSDDKERTRESHTDVNLTRTYRRTFRSAYTRIGNTPNASSCPRIVSTICFDAGRSGGRGKPPLKPSRSRAAFRPVIPNPPPIDRANGVIFRCSARASA